ncbi:MAG: bifunctional 4-hydroxy-3-methylbut-2-enyl diphosphate reductase/30S ribosomal protein S1 [Clostridia bacterium]|nr:bifunctional 4-hydroxy-3-methylbut-2-enyl diphosphate reductase/30S ribosomal protein S1 [Clostridia bacterium]
MQSFTIIESKEGGFCYGVQRAIDMALEASKEAETVYTLGDIIHNEHVVEELRSNGVIAIEDVCFLKPGDKLIIRSHGATLESVREARQRGADILDATCPNVAKIHAIAEEMSLAGFSVIITGSSKHPEVLGILSRCSSGAFVVETMDQVDALPKLSKVCLLSQTTFSAERFFEIKTRVLLRWPEAVCKNTICGTTKRRQVEACEMSQRCTHMIVIGGRNSSNTKKLFEICKKNCKKVQIIANSSELMLEKIERGDIIGVIAGASTPQLMIREVITRMSDKEKTMAENVQEAEDAATVTKPTTAADAAPTNEPATETSNEDSFAAALEKTFVRIRNGQIVKGSVVQIVDGEVCVNIGYKADGLIPRSEFSHDEDVDPASVVKVGDTIEVEVIKINDGEGNVLLSRKNVEQKKLWETLLSSEDLEDTTKVYDAIAKEAVKGGLIALINGVRAFVPASQISNEYVGKIEDYVGKPMRLRIIEVDKQRKRIVASQKVVLAEEAKIAKAARYEELKPGMKVKGIVRRIADFGAFVDIGGIEGLVHVTEVAWGRQKNIADYLSVGQEVELLVLKVDAAKERISLSYRQLQPRPWETAVERYPVGSIVEGKVVRILEFGAFVSLEPTIDGLIHISQVGARRVEKVEDELKIDDVVRCKVLEVNPEARKMSLSRKQAILEENPEIAEELAKERAERNRKIAEERAAARKAQQQEREKQQDRPQRSERPQGERRPRPERNSEGGERPQGERRPRRDREEVDYTLPPVESATTSLGSLFANFTPDEN